MSSPTAYQHLRSRLHLALGLNAVIISAEFAGGWMLNSIGLMSDAGHNLIDQGSLFLALYAHLLTARPATETRTFGYHRAGIIAAFANSSVLLFTALGIAVVGIQRLMHPVPVDGGWVMAIAGVSFIANLGIASLLQHGAKDDLNIRSAFWHMIGDAWVSLGVIVSGAGIMMTGLVELDPLVSLLVVGAIFFGAWPIFRESLDVLLESAPSAVKASQVAAAIESIPGVDNVHDLHIWAIEPRLIMLTCHVLVRGDDEALTNSLLAAIRSRITGDFGIKHMTIQLETHCTHPDVRHCNLNVLTEHHHDHESLHVHH
ncbi:cation diffusion facilitator family transporter [Nitrospira sp. KM1]|uniref:cation diffusion facilitator family transporter n=1 Tax=Nitrospira sp. KM1 TaxID=1936990 RepID=UPI001563B2DA|nr:cation diffusion facilitator family transporter [Nitrospira sp. KM1]